MSFMGLGLIEFRDRGYIMVRVICLEIRVIGVRDLSL
jgi:hypothetical protein